ncbi:interleukin-4 [Anser cygnoides]|uniref:Lymphocyte stimulatory factor 1 n=1 Tax=Anser brachyrhynchus TaxID=132585 RepID=A0A8B9I9H5_9AVES|nr:interleukin-4 [Anser cygnoides]
MSISFSVLLTFLALLACHSHEAAVLERSIFLKESIRLLGEILSTQVSCDKTNVTNVFAGNETDNDMEILCKASTVVFESLGCHKQLKGIYLNLLHIATEKSSGLKAPCPVAAGNTTSLQEFLGGLHRTLQRVAKENL